jgi:hypothetical protein
VSPTASITTIVRIERKRSMTPPKIVTLRSAARCGGPPPPEDAAGLLRCDIRPHRRATVGRCDLVVSVR